MTDDDQLSRSRSNSWPLPQPDFEQAEQRALSSSKKTPSRRNPWGNLSYAELITQAILSTPDKRLTLSQIYEWMVRNVPYFSDKADSTSSAGWKNSIRHNLSLHSRFMRITNEGPGKSSWWLINPDAKAGRPVRRRAMSTDASSGAGKSDTKRRGRHRRTGSKGAFDTATAAAGGSPAPSPAPSLTSTQPPFSPNNVKVEADGPFTQHCLTPSSLYDSDSSAFGGGSSTSPYDGFSPLGDAAPFTGPLPGTSEQFGIDYYHDHEPAPLLTTDIGALADPLSSLCVSNHHLVSELDTDRSFPPITIDSAPINPAPSTFFAPFQPTLSPISGTPLVTPVATPLGTPPAVRQALRAVQAEDGQYTYSRSLSTEHLYHPQHQAYYNQSYGQQPIMRNAASWQHLNQPQHNSFYAPCNPPPPYGCTQSWSPDTMYKGYAGPRVALSANEYHPLMPPSQQPDPVPRLTHHPMPAVVRGSPVYGHAGHCLNQSVRERFPSDLDIHLFRDSFDGFSVDDVVNSELPQTDSALLFDFEHFQEENQNQSTVSASTWGYERQWVH